MQRLWEEIFASVNAKRSWKGKMGKITLFMWLTKDLNEHESLTLLLFFFKRFTRVIKYSNVKFVDRHSMFIVIWPNIRWCIVKISRSHVKYATRATAVLQYWVNIWNLIQVAAMTQYQKPLRLHQVNRYKHQWLRWLQQLFQYRQYHSPCTNVSNAKKCSWRLAN